MTVYISSQADKFLRQKGDYDWLIAGCTGGAGVDTFDERVVYTTFPSTLTKHDFEEYVDKKFSSLSGTDKDKLKALYKAITDIDLEKNVQFSYEPNGTIKATLTMMLFERTGTVLRVAVGYINYTRKPTAGWQHLYSYWESNTDRVVRGLQYKYGLELKRELE